MKLLSATDLAIATAIRAGTLRTVEREGRFGPYVSIEDERGIIEASNDAAEATSRINAIRALI